ncbi:MAG: SAM-dependent chlorinase/fluorinase [Chloroflexi bacterium]|nr:SAM-dependent chlorinase/fluorinase [Chloroflexota bacterium]
MITLLTDFGSDAYAGAVKGAILSINPSATLVDLTHQVPPQDVHAGAFLLRWASATFPKGTLHLAVVDPGVGTARRPLLLITPDAAYIGPDNGLFTYALPPVDPVGDTEPGFLQPVPRPVLEGTAAYVLNNPRYWRQPVSPTFHGRDLFGPVAAHLSLGVPPHDLGEPTDTVTSLYVPKPRRTKDALEGVVLHVDSFGNLVTNISAGQVAGKRVEVGVAGRTIRGLTETYGDGSGLLAVVGSHGLLEVAVRNGNAARELRIGRGEPVRLRIF